MGILVLSYPAARDWVWEYVIVQPTPELPGEGFATILTYGGLAGHAIPTKLYQNALQTLHLKPDWENHVHETLSDMRFFELDGTTKQPLRPFGELEHGEYRQEVQLSSQLPLRLPLDLDPPKNSRFGVLRTPAQARRQLNRSVSWDPERNVAWITSKIYPEDDRTADSEPSQWLKDWVDRKDNHFCRGDCKALVGQQFVAYRSEPKEAEVKEDDEVKEMKDEEMKDDDEVKEAEKDEEKEATTA